MTRHGKAPELTITLWFAEDFRRQIIRYWRAKNVYNQYDHSGGIVPANKLLDLFIGVFYSLNYWERDNFELYQETLDAVIPDHPSHPGVYVTPLDLLHLVFEALKTLPIPQDYIMLRWLTEDIGIFGRPLMLPMLARDIAI